MRRRETWTVVMQHSRDRDGEGWDVGAAFADPTFTTLKARGAPFVILRPDTGTVVWANAAAAHHWAAVDRTDLSRILFGTDGRGGWLAGLDRGLVPGRAPRLARAGLARGFGMRAHTALLRAWTTADGTPLIGLAVPDADAEPVADPEAWRRDAWVPEPAVPALPVAEAPSGAAGAPDQDADRAESGAALARRGQLAVLRDRLSHAVDGATTLRLLWRTDAGGAVVSIDDAAFARLGSPVRFAGAALPDAVAPFDPAGAGRLHAALATRVTWAGIFFDLPVADAAATVPVAISGSPFFGPDRAFAGYRGFGTIDLGRLALAIRPPSAPSAEVGTPGPQAGGVAGTAPEAAVIEPPPSAVDAPPPSAAPPLEPAPATVAAEPPSEPPGAANVVQLRAFQGQASGRFGIVPPPPVPSPAAPGGQKDGPSAPSGGEPLSDQLAFLALGAAIRARIDPSHPLDTAAPLATAAGPQASSPVAATGDPAASMLDRLPVAVLAIAAGRPVFANPAAAARLGYRDAADLLGAGEAMVVSTDETDRIALRDAEGRAVTSAAWRADVAWAGATATLWLLSEPEAESVQDAAPFAEPAADEAESGEDRSIDLLDRVDDAVALLDAAGRLRRLNRRGEGWFGPVAPGPAPARSLVDLLTPESRPAALALLGEVGHQRDAPGAPPLRRDVVARTGEGAAVPMLLTLGRLGASGFYATLRDLSALQRAETARARTETDHARAAGRLPELLAKVSHEIRTPLGAILGFAEVMMDERFGPLGNPRYKDYLKDIHAAGAQVVALVDDLLDLSRIEAGQVELDVAAVDINRVVTDAVAQMQPEAHRERVIMRTSLAGRVPAVLADERSARQIVKSLLSNAVKFNEPGGQVIVSTAVGEAGAVLLRVRDTGVGMSDEEIAAALEPFGGVPTHSPSNGNGLGLPLTRALVGANGASMTIRSRPREGTLVEVAFAASQPAEARLPA